jgi:signal transduction histidine kinase
MSALPGVTLCFEYSAILLNFLSNDVKFTPEGGAVVVPTALAVDDSLLLSVRDSGIGMTPTEIAVAISPFGQSIPASPASTKERG